MCKRKSWMSKVGMGEGQVWQGNWHAGGAGPLHMLFHSAWLFPTSPVPGREAGREGGRSPCEACAACSVSHSCAGSWVTSR